MAQQRDRDRSHELSCEISVAHLFEFGLDDVSKQEDTMTQISSQNKPLRLWRLFLKVQNPFMKWLQR